MPKTHYSVFNGRRIYGGGVHPPFTIFFDFRLRSLRYEKDFLQVLSKLSQASMFRIFHFPDKWKVVSVAPKREDVLVLWATRPLRHKTWIIASYDGNVSTMFDSRKGERFCFLCCISGRDIFLLYLHFLKWKGEVFLSLAIKWYAREWSSTVNQ